MTSGAVRVPRSQDPKTWVPRHHQCNLLFSPEVFSFPSVFAVMV
jgi:hypothetical protein